ncbi:MAG: M10 family metallopeptidase C-terminal domain-containing protein [Pseudomonadota bacterium]
MAVMNIRGSVEDIVALMETATLVEADYDGTEILLLYDADGQAIELTVGGTFNYNGSWLSAYGKVDSITLDVLGNSTIEVTATDIGYRLFEEEILTDTWAVWAYEPTLLSQDDRITASDGNDIVFGWNGDDMIRGNNGSDILYGGNGDDRIIGGNGADTSFGGSGKDTLNGNGGSDTLWGQAGSDKLNGGNSTDVLIGGEGADVQRGGGGSDVFQFLSVEDSGPAKADRDLIKDFKPGTDLIDLSAIDADSTTLDDDRFDFVGPDGFSGAAGELTYSYIAGRKKTLLEADIDGDGDTDFSIELSGALVLNGDDFVL